MSESSRINRFFRLNDIIREVYAEQQAQINQRIAERIQAEFGDTVEVQKLDHDCPYAAFMGPCTGGNRGKTRMRMVVSLVDLVFDREKL